MKTAGFVNKLYNAGIGIASDRFGSTALAISRNSTIRAVTIGLMNLIPLALVGSFVVAFLNLPIPPFQTFMTDLFGVEWNTIGSMIHYGTLNIIGLAALLSVSYTMATEAEAVKHGEINPIIPVVASLSSYVILLEWGEDLLIIHKPGSTGLLHSVLIAVVVIKLFFAFLALGRRVRPAKKSVFNINLRLRSAFRAIFPLCAVLLIFSIVRVLLDMSHVDEMVSARVVELINSNMSDGSLGAIVIVVLLTQLCWFFGLNGGSLVMDNLPLASSGTTVNMVDFAGGIQPVFSKEFFDTFIYLGGSGATIGLLLAMLFVGFGGRDKKIAKMSVFPSIFNINETLMYGIPLIFNPFYLIPFMLVPVLLGVISYAMLTQGVVPPIIDYDVRWTTPVFLSGYLATGSFAGVVLQAAGIFISTIIYMPFVILSGRYDRSKRHKDFAILHAAALRAADNEYISLTSRGDRIGEMAREFVTELHDYFSRDDIPFHMEYQPKTDESGQVMGAEALLRWRHHEYGYISPPVIIEMTDEAGLSKQLGEWITRRSLSDFAYIRSRVAGSFRMSINLNPRHLSEDPHFAGFVREAIAEAKVAAAEVELELTEHMIIRPTKKMVDIFKDLRSQGITLSIDDLGMGYSSLSYITDFGVGAVKIDASFAQSIEDNEKMGEIVRSIINLADQINLEVTVEGVETRGQVDALLDLGAHYFQGWYFSKALPAEEFIDFARAHRILAIESS